MKWTTKWTGLLILFSMNLILLGCATSSINESPKKNIKKNNTTTSHKKTTQPVIKNAQVIRLETEVFKSPNFEN